MNISHNIKVGDTQCGGADITLTVQDVPKDKAATLVNQLVELVPGIVYDEPWHRFDNLWINESRPNSVPVYITELNGQSVYGWKHTD